MDKVSSRKKKAKYPAEVAQNLRIGTRFYRLSLIMDQAGSKIYRNVMPGQFALFDLSRTPLPPDNDIPDDLLDASKKQILLRRPFSFSDVIISNDGTITLQVLYCVLGPSTLRMTALSQGDTLYISPPQGNGFSVPKNLKTALLTAGGMGAPPVQHLAGYIKQNRPDVDIAVFIGAKTFDDMPYYNLVKDSPQTTVEEFARHGIDKVHIATDDGSMGQRGLVTDLLTDFYETNPLSQDSTVIYACGPEPMLKALARTSKKLNIPCQLSMERVMACGMGLCQSCAVKINDGQASTSFKYQLCCKDGPVFSAENLFFQEK
jgi:dihydroorotate dehydrogenase electron transfer subunit